MIGELEDAIVARIELLKPALPYSLPTIDSYGGQIDESAQATFKFPAVFVSFVNMKTDKAFGERDRLCTVNLVLYVCTRNARNERSRRQGSAHEVGSYQLAEDMIALLENQSLGMPMHRALMHTKIDTLFVARKSDGANAESILAVGFECAFVWEAALPECANGGAPVFASPPEEWKRTGQTFYIKPGDDTADLTALTEHAPNP